MVSIPSGGGKREELVYKAVGSRELMLTYIPPKIKKYKKSPLLFLIPGGGWHIEERAAMLDFAAAAVERVRNEGFSVVSTDYRVFSTDKASMHDVICDCFDAMKYVARYADILNVDKDRIAVSGHSAGGHLALMLAYAPIEEFGGNDSGYEFKIAAAAPMSPPAILYTEGVEQTLNIADISDMYLEENTEQERKRTSPYTYVNGACPPTIISAGTSDRCVFPNSAELLYRKLRENHVPCELVLSLGGGHMLEAMHEGIEPTPSKLDILNRIAEFIIKYIAHVVIK